MAYTVKKGDTLGAIAKQFNISLEELIKLNNIKNPNLIRSGQQLDIPGKNSKANVPNSYVIKKGDTLSGIGKQYKVDWKEIAKLNNINDPRSIRPGQKLKLPNNNFEGLPTQLDTTNRDEVEKLQILLVDNGADIKTDGIYGKKTQQAIDTIYKSKNLTAPKIITAKDKLQGKSFHKASEALKGIDAIHQAHKGKDDYYSVVDKKTNTFKVFKDGKLHKEFRVGLGSKSGKDFITGITGEKGYTGAGIYSLSDKTLWNTPGQEKYFKRLYGENILTLENESGIVQGMAIHQVPKGNTSKVNRLKDSNINNDDFSWGCINCTKEDYEDYMQYAATGNKVYVMPEEEGNYFEFRNNKVNLTTNKADKDISKYNYTYTGTGNYLSPKTQQQTYTPVSYEFPNSNEKTKQFINSLETNKKALMQQLNVDSDTYDKMAKSAVGLLGAESDFGKRKWNRKPENSVFLEELYMDVAEKLGKDQSHRSSGLTQIRYENIPKDIKDQYGITRDDLMNPEKAAIATMGMLGQYHQNIIRNRGKLPNLGMDNIQEYYPYAHNQPSSLETGARNNQPLDPSSNTYVSKVNKIANQVIMKKKKLKGGGKMKPSYEKGFTPDMAASLAQMVPGLIGAIPRTQAPGAGGDMQGLTSALGAAGSIASIIPGGEAIGAGLNIASSIANEINLPSDYVPMGENQGKFSRVKGGSLNPISSNSYEVQGNNPSVTDGVELPNAFVDHGETISGDYVFSTERMNPFTGNTFAKDAKKIAKAKGKAEKLPYDTAAKNTLKYLGEQEQKLAGMQDTINGLLGEAQQYKQSLKGGGKLDPLAGAENIKLLSEDEPKMNYWQALKTVLPNSPHPMFGTTYEQTARTGLGMAAAMVPIGKGVQAVLASRAARAAGIQKYMGYLDDAIQQGIQSMQARKFRAGQQAYRTVKEGLDAGEAAVRATQAGKFRAGKAASEVVRSAKPYTSTTAQSAAKSAAKEAMTNPGIVSSAKAAARTAVKDAFTQPGVISSADDMAAAVAKEIMAGSKMAPSEAMAAAKQLVSEAMKSNIKTGAGNLTAKQIAQQAFAKGKAITKSTLKEAQQLFPNSPKIKSTNVSDYSKLFKEGLAGGGMMKPAYQYGINGNSNNTSSITPVRENPYDTSKLRPLIDFETGRYIGGPPNTEVTDQMASGVGGIQAPPAEPDAVTRADAGVTYGVNRGPGTDPMFDPMGYFGRAQVPTAAAPGNNPLTATVNNLGGGAAAAPGNNTLTATVNNLGGGTSATSATSRGKGKGKKEDPFEPWISNEQMNTMLERSLDPLTATDMPNLNLPYDSVTSTTKEEPGLGPNIPGVRGFYPNAPKQQGNWWGDKSEGERLQMMEAFGKAGMLLQGYDKQPLYQNRAAITRQQFDPQNALMQQQYAANAARQGIQNSSTGASQMANLQNLSANQMRAAGQVQTQYDQMNQQARSQYEQRLAQRQQENIGYKYATDQIRQQDESAYWNQFRDVMTGIGNMGREKVAVEENEKAVKLLISSYPDLVPFLDSLGIDLSKFKTKSQPKEKPIGDRDAFQNFLSGKLGKTN